MCKFQTSRKKHGNKGSPIDPETGKEKKKERKSTEKKKEKYIQIYQESQ